MAAEAAGVTTQKLNDMLENGEVLAVDLIPQLADILEGRFSKAAIRAALTSRASFNRFNNAILELKETLSSSGISDSFAMMAEASTAFLRTLGKDNVKTTVVVSLGTIIDTITILKRTFDIAWKSVQLGFAVINTAAWEFTNVLVNGPIENTKRLITLFNSIPNMPDIKLPEGITNFGDSISSQLNYARNSVIGLSAELNKLMFPPEALPSDELINRVTTINEVFEDLSQKKPLQNIGQTVDEFLSSFGSDKLETQEKAAIAKITKKFNAIIKLTEENSKERKRLETELNIQIGIIQDDFAKRRQSNLQTAFKKEHSEIKKSLELLISDGNKAKAALEKSYKVEQTPEIVQLQEKLRAAILSGAEAAKQFGKIWGKESSKVLTDTQEQIIALNALVSESKKRAKEEEAGLKRIISSGYKLQEVYDSSTKSGVVQTEQLKSLQEEAKKSLQEFYAAKEEYSKKYADATEKEKLKTRDLGKEIKDLMEVQSKNPLINYIGLLEKSLDGMTPVLTTMVNGLSGLEDAFVEIAMTGKTSFESLVSSILSDIIRYETRALITIPIAKTLNALMSGESVSSSTSSAGGVVGVIGNLVTSFFHGGGVVGRDSTMTRSMPSSLFTNAPKFHNGLLSDEYPAILKKDESVLTPGQLAAVSGSSPGGSTAIGIEFNITNKTNQEVSARQESMKFDSQSKKMIIGVILEAAQNNTGGFKTAMKQVVKT